MLELIFDKRESEKVEEDKYQPSLEDILIDGLILEEELRQLEAEVR